MIVPRADAAIPRSGDSVGASAYRVQLLAWFESRSGSIFDLAGKPRSRAAYRCYITPLG